MRIVKHLAGVGKDLGKVIRQSRGADLSPSDRVEVHILEVRLEAVTLARRALAKLLRIAKENGGTFSEADACRFLNIPTDLDELDRQLRVIRIRVEAGLDPIPPIYRQVLEATPALEALAKAEFKAGCKAKGATKDDAASVQEGGRE